MKLGILIVAVGLLWPASGYSKGLFVFTSGNQLLAMCSAPQGSEPLSRCLAYVAGVSDSVAELDYVCGTPAITVGQSVDVVVKYLRAHPETRHLSGASQAAHALEQAFPCK
jgi:Rap1a immunity proteins